MKEKIEAAIIKCLEDNGYAVRHVEIGELPKTFQGEETLMVVYTNLQIKAVEADSKLGKTLIKIKQQHATNDTVL